MTKQLFVNLPVKDLEKSIEFFTTLGFKFNPQFTDKNATCMIINESAFVMLLVKPFFQTFIAKEIADSFKVAETINSISMESKEKVDELVDKAIEGGATKYKEAMDQAGFMYQKSFQDLDGHLWEVLWMDQAALSVGN